MKNIMKRAWEMMKEANGALFSECLKEAWKESKQDNKDNKVLEMSQWIFEQKMLDRYELKISGKTRENMKKYGCAYCGYKKQFSKENIVRETEKAYLVEVQSEFDTDDDKEKVWIPKSQVNEVENFGTFDYFEKKFKDGSWVIENNYILFLIKTVANVEYVGKQHGTSYLTYRATNKNDSSKFFTYNV